MKNRLKSIVFVRWWAAVVALLLIAVLSSERAVAQEAHYHDAFHTHTEAPLVRTEWGIGIGGAYTGLYRTSAIGLTIKPRFSFQGHLDFAVCIGNYFAIETEIAYEGGSIDVASKNLERRVKTRTIDVPVLLSLRLASNIVRLSAGPVFTVMSRSEYTHNGDVMFYGPTYPTWNIAGGVAVSLNRYFIIEARYTHSLVDCTNQFDGIEFSTRPYKVTLGLGIMF